MIAEDDKYIKINGKELAGIITELEIKNSVILEELEVEGSGKKPKQATGFEDAQITISLSLRDYIQGQTKEEKLLSIQNLFRQKNQKIPNVYDIANKHINQRNIYKIILKDLSTKESNKKDEISISLTLAEYEAVTVKVKSTTSTTITSTTNSSTITNKTATTSSAYASYLEKEKNIDFAIIKITPKILTQISLNTGDNIEVKLGYNGSFITKFVGNITEIKRDEIIAKNKFYKLLNIEINKNFVNCDFLEVLNFILSQADITEKDIKSENYPTKSLVSIKSLNSLKAI